MKNLNVKIEYIYHSGFTVETENHFLIFDYYKGNIELPDKNTSIFVSHGHEDHYNPNIFDFKGNINYVLSDDIKVDKKVNFVHPGSHIKIDGLEIKVFGSTDLGVSFLVFVDNISIFHAGDLNWWYWKDDSDLEKQNMEKEFKSEIEKIKGLEIDLAFFPVDPRLEDAYFFGGEYFIKELSPKYFFPMHFGDNFDKVRGFIHKMEDKPTEIMDIKKINQRFSL